MGYVCGSCGVRVWDHSAKETKIFVLSLHSPSFLDVTNSVLRANPPQDLRVPKILSVTPLNKSIMPSLRTEWRIENSFII